MTGRLIGFAHRAQVGKDTAVRAAGLSRFAFADKIRLLILQLNPYIKQANAHLLDLYDEEAGWQQLKSEYHEIRQYLQELGAGGRDIIDPNLWIGNLLGDIDYFRSLGMDCGIADVRYPNEAEAIRARGGKLIRIDRADATRLEHPSDCALDDWSDWDHVIENDGTLGEFEDKVRALLGGS
jgi:hypothetical protein